MSLKIYKLEITKEEYLKLKERLFELNPNIKLELVSCDDNLEKLGFTNSAPCKVDLHINEEEHKRLMDELMSIEEGVRELSYGMFYNCSNLKDIYIPSSVEKIDDKALNRAGWYGIYPFLEVTIHAPAGSYAEQYAKEYNINFIAE